MQFHQPIWKNNKQFNNKIKFINLLKNLKNN